MKRLLISSLLLGPGLVLGQGGLDPSEILKPLGDQWTTYSGDYTGRRYSSLKQINQSTVKNLSLSWVARFTTGCGPTGAGGESGGGGFGGRGGGGAPAPIIAGGLIRPISAHFYLVPNFRTAKRILVMRLARRSRMRRSLPLGSVRRNISSTC